jgi:hypothetical protein
MTIEDRLAALERRVADLARRIGEAGPWFADAPARSRDNIRDATTWAHRFTRSEMTSGEGDAWRAGRDAAEQAVRAVAARMRATCGNDQQCLSCVSTLDIAADGIARLEPRAEETGLDGRGA